MYLPVAQSIATFPTLLWMATCDGNQIGTRLEDCKGPFVRLLHSMMFGRRNEKTAYLFHRARCGHAQPLAQEHLAMTIKREQGGNCRGHLSPVHSKLREVMVSISNVLLTFTCKMSVIHTSSRQDVDPPCSCCPPKFVAAISNNYGSLSGFV